MCAAKELQTLNRMGMELAFQGRCRAGLTLLALALRITLRRRSAVQEARVRNNMALALHAAGKYRLAKRQVERAMSLVAAKVGQDNRLYRTLQQHQLQTSIPLEAQKSLAA